MAFPRSRLLSLAILLLVAAPAFAETQNGGALVLLDEFGYRIPYAVAPQPDSGALIICGDTRNTAVEFYAQRTNSRGRPQWGPGGKLVKSFGAGPNVSTPIPDGAGGFLFAWEEWRGATGVDIYVQRVLADGSLAYASPGVLVCSAAFDQVNPFIVLGTGGSYYVCWNDARANVANVSDWYVQRYTLAGAAQFLANGLLVNSTTFRPSRFTSPAIAPDLFGGLLLAWPVNTGGLRAQRVSSAGVLQFGATGAALADPLDSYATIAPDGTGGMWAATVRSSGANYTPYAHRLSATGVSSFVAAGMPIRSAISGNTMRVTPVRDASSGCFFFILPYGTNPLLPNQLQLQEMTSAGVQLRGPNAYVLSYAVDDFNVLDQGSSFVLTSLQRETASGGTRQRVQRFAFDGTMQYPGMGKVLGRSDPESQFLTSAVSVTAGGLMYVAFADERYLNPLRSTYFQAFGQMFDPAGNSLWDDAENPVLSVAKDAPADQGGLVRIGWEAGMGDMSATRVVTGYRGWRALGSAPAALAGKLAVRPEADAPFRVGTSNLVLHANLYWEQVASSPASQLPSYALTVPTGQDSSSLGSADESFMVEAYDDSSHHWWSNVLVAHSVDNIAPVTPAPFTGQYGAGVTHLHWNPNTEPDLTGYRLYRGSSSGFVPGPENLVAALSDTGHVDASGAAAVYKLTAVDTHGNQSAPAVLIPVGALGVESGGLALRFALASRNPSRMGATLRLSLPSAARVRVGIYDAAGREVRSLVSGERAAGEWMLEWDGADAAGQRAASGLYFAKLETGGTSRTVRLVLTH